MFFPVPCWGSGLPPRPLLQVWGCLGSPALLLPAGVLSLGRWLNEPFSRWRPLTRWSSLKLRFVGGSWLSPLCSPGRRSVSRFTYSALPPVSRLFFGLAAFSFGWGFGLCLTILLAPCGCRCACCDPPCGRESARVLPSLLGPSSSGVCHLSRVGSTVGGPRSFLVVALSASAVGFADALWLCPERALSSFFASVSLIGPVALSPLLHRVFADGFRLWCAFRFCGGPSPRVLVP